MRLHSLLILVSQLSVFMACQQSPSPEKRNVKTDVVSQDDSRDARESPDRAESEANGNITGQNTPQALDLSCMDSKPSFKIVGGSIVEQMEDKVSLSTIAISDETGVFCTGTLIGPNHIVTAAHCFYEDETSTSLFSEEKVKSLRIGMGVAGTPLADVQVIAGGPHELFQFDSDGADVGFLVIKGQLPPSARPVQVPEYREDDVIEKVLKAGYGATSDADEEPGMLRKVEVAVMKFYPELGEFDLVNGQSVGTCLGDSGGPAFIPSTKNPGCFEVIGATSRGARDESITDCDSGNGIDTDLRVYREWLGCSFKKLGSSLPYLSDADLNCA